MDEMVTELVTRLGIENARVYFNRENKPAGILDMSSGIGFELPELNEKTIEKCAQDFETLKNVKNTTFSVSSSIYFFEKELGFGDNFIDF